MKKSIIFVLLALGLAGTSCVDLDLNPLSQASSGTWNDSPDEIKMSANDLFRAELWRTIEDTWTDDEASRNNRNDYINGTITSETWQVRDMWRDCYYLIGRVHSVMEDLLDMGNPGILTQAEYNQYLGECYFVRACMYSRLVFHFGDVPYVDHMIDIDTAFGMGRDPKDEVLEHIYSDFEQAVNLLPETSPAEQRVTKGAALGMWARTALWFSDWDKVIECTSQIIGSEIYELYPNFGELFLSTTHNTKESVFSLARSVNFGLTQTGWQNYVPRNNGGYAQNVPTWDLLAAFLCIDGKPIDETGVGFDCANPFKNRDPRCAMTIVEFGSTVLGYEYDPNVETGAQVTGPAGTQVRNNDNKVNQDVASYTGLIWRKWLDETCYQNDWETGHDHIILRYADVLLMYAEAKIEKNEIDDSVLEAMNSVRARAYNGYVYEGENPNAPETYPKITTTDQSELRTILRYERRMELAKENNRYYDLIRWRLMDKALKGNLYGIFQDDGLILKYMNNQDAWLWAFVPEMDENGIADFTTRYEQMRGSSPNPYYGYAYILQSRSFQTKQYLWPIPANEILINDNMEQNPGY